MTLPLRRRAFLGATSAIVSMGLAGCGNPNSAPVRKLSFREVNVEETDESWFVSFKITNTNEASDALAAFHDVEVHGYDRDRTEVCTEYVGMVSGDRHRGNGIPIEMMCSEFPTMITYSAAESPCDDDVRTVIKILIYDDENGWHTASNSRECGEGLPPENRNSESRS